MYCVAIQLFILGSELFLKLSYYMTIHFLFQQQFRYILVSNISQKLNIKTIKLRVRFLKQQSLCSFQQQFEEYANGSIYLQQRCVKPNLIQDQRQLCFWLFLLIVSFQEKNRQIRFYFLENICRTALTSKRVYVQRIP